MTTHAQLRSDLAKALRAKEEVRLTVLRSLLAAFINESVAKGRKPDVELPGDEALVVIRRAAKQRKDSIEQFEKGGRVDLAEREKQELAVIESYLPQMMSTEEIRRVASAKKDELGITDPAQKGQLMGAVMQELKGKADGSEVKAVVDALFE